MLPLPARTRLQHERVARVGDRAQDGCESWSVQPEPHAIAAHFDWHSLLKAGFFVGWLPLLVVGVRDASWRAGPQRDAAAT